MTTATAERKHTQEQPKHVRTRYTSTRYTEAQKAKAITAVKMLGGLNEAAIAEARKILGTNVSKSALWTWLQQDIANTVDTTLSIPQPDLPSIIDNTAIEVIRDLQTAARKASKRLSNDDIINNASFKDLALGNGIILTKLKELAGLSPELEHKVSQLQQACNRANVDILSLMDDMINQVESTPVDLGTTIGEGDFVGKA